MAVRTPGIQPRSQYHAYWGRYDYNAAGPQNVYGGRAADVGYNLLPNAPSNPISGVEFAKLEAGDVAATVNFSGPVGSQFGFWMCISPGTSGGGDAVWVRLDNANLAVQTIRDAHVIVVAQQGGGFAPTTGVPATDTLLNLNPQVAGIAADFIDPGDGTELANALVAAAALSTGGTPCDVRLRPCNIDLGTVTSPATPLTIPTSTRLVGSADNQSSLNGKRGAAEDQRILSCNAGASLEKIQFISQAPTGAPAATAGGLVNVAGPGVDIVDCAFLLQIGVNARSTLACIDDGLSFGSRLHVERCRFNGGGSHASLFAAESVAIRTVGTTATILPGAILHALTIQGFDVGIQITAVGAYSGDITVSQVNGTNIHRALVALFADATQGVGYRFADMHCVFSQDGVPTTPQTVIEGVTQNNLGAFSQISVSGTSAFWLSTTTVTDRNFARFDGDFASNGVTGVKIVACGVDQTTGSAAATDAIFLADRVRGGDILCDWANAAASLATTGTPTWEQAHSV